jgi:hypothetical protein
MASSKPPVLPEVDPVERGKKLRTVGAGDPTMVVDGVSMVVGGDMLMRVAESTAIAGEEPTTIGGAGDSMAIADEVSATIGDAGESTMVVDAGESMMTGEGAGEFVDPDPIVPTVSAN